MSDIEKVGYIVPELPLIVRTAEKGGQHPSHRQNEDEEPPTPHDTLELHGEEVSGDEVQPPESEPRQEPGSVQIPENHLDIAA